MLLTTDALSADTRQDAVGAADWLCACCYPPIIKVMLQAWGQRRVELKVCWL
jgi:hypothetical protein